MNLFGFYDMSTGGISKTPYAANDEPKVFIDHLGELHLLNGAKAEEEE